MKRFFKHIFLLLFIFTSVAVNAQSGKISTTHKVEAGETVYGISHKYGISTDDLRNANPEMIDAGFGLKAGDIIVIPEKGYGSVSKNANKGRTINVGIMLPLNNQGRDGQHMVEYYRGILMACNYLKREDFNINVYAWDVTRNADVDKILKEKNAAKCDVIFGPFYSHQVPALSEFARRHDVRIVVPFAAGGIDLQDNPNMYVLGEFNPAFDIKSCAKFLSLFSKVNPVIIDCNDSKNARGGFTSTMRNMLEHKNIEYNITNLNSSEVKFIKAFKKNRDNIVILNSAGDKAFSAAVEKLNVVRAKYPDIKISMIGFVDWFGFEKFKLSEFAANDVYIPTYFYYNAHSASTIRLESDYFRWFKNKMTQSIPRFALAGYDHANFFLRGINKFGSNFTGAKEQNVAGHVHMPIHFERVSLNGGQQNTAFMFIHYKKDKSIESIAY